MKYSGYWLSIVETNIDNHVVHTFLSYNSFLSFTESSHQPHYVNKRWSNLGGFYFGQPEQFHNYADVGCSKIITLTVNIIVYDSIFQRCDRHRQLPGYLSFNSLTLEPSRPPSLARPDSLRTGAYRLEIISAA